MVFSDDDIENMEKLAKTQEDVSDADVSAAAQFAGEARNPLVQRLAKTGLEPLHFGLAKSIVLA